MYNIMGPVEVNSRYYAVIKIRNSEFLQYSETAFQFLSLWIRTLLG